MSSELSLLATVLVFISFLLSISDVLRAKRENLNGAIRFMTLDNVRHQVCLMTLILMIIAASPISYMCAVLIFDALFTFYRRGKMAALVADYITHRGQQEAADVVRAEIATEQLATDIKQRNTAGRQRETARRQERE